MSGVEISHFKQDCNHHLGDTLVARLESSRAIYITCLRGNINGTNELRLLIPVYVLYIWQEVLADRTIRVK